MNTKFTNNTLRNLFLVAVTTLILSALLYPGMQATDDLSYAYKAYHVLNKSIQIDGTSHKIGRIGVYLPLSLVFGIFGVSDFSLALIPIVCTTLTSVLIYGIGAKLYGNAVGLLSGLLFSFFPLTLSNGNLMLPEPILIFFLCAAAVLFLESNGSDEKLTCFIKIIVGVLIGFAYLVAEVGSLLLPVLIMTQLIRREVSKSDLMIILGFCFVVCGELIFYAVIYDNPLHRYTALGSDYVNDPMLMSANKDITYRLFKAYPKYFLYPDLALGFFGPLLILGAICGISNIRKNIFLLTWAAAILVFFNFMTVSFDQYILLPVASRLIYPGLIPLIILSAKFITAFWQWSNRRPKVLCKISTFCFVTIILFLCISSIAVSYLRMNTHSTAVIARNSEAVADFIQTEPQLTLFSDQRTLDSISFYRGFRDSDDLILLKDYESFISTNPAYNKKKLIIINGPVYDPPASSKAFSKSSEKSKKNMDEALKPNDNVIFHSSFTRGIIFEKLLSLGVIEMVMSDTKYKVLTELIAGNNPSGWVTVIEK